MVLLILMSAIAVALGAVAATLQWRTYQQLRAEQRIPHPNAEAMAALRNVRLWNAHATRLQGRQRDEALQAAAAWSQIYDQQLRYAPGPDRVPPRRGAQAQRYTPGRFLLEYLPGVAALVVAAPVLLLLVYLWKGP